MSMDNAKPVEAALARFLDGEPRPEDSTLLAAAMEKDPAFAQEVRRLLAIDDLLRQAADLGPVTFLDTLQTRLAAEADGARFTQVVLEHLPPPTADHPVTEAAPAVLPLPPRRFRWGRLSLAVAIAAAVLLAVSAAWWLPFFAGRPKVEPEAAPEIAWLINAQNCRWEDGGAPAGAMGPGKVLRLAQGLAELHFQNGVCLVLQGPARLELLSDNRVRLLLGALAARVPEGARGFEVLSPGGSVVDLGTEFGVRVAEDGTTRMHVFRGEIEARPAGEALAAAVVKLRKEQSARMGATGITVEPRGAGAETFVREIVPPPVVVPRTLALDFSQPIPGTIPDAAGHGTGLTHRLPGTRNGLREPDEFLKLNTELGRLELTATDNELHKQRKLEQGEYVGVRLADLGFTGTEDFSVTVVVPDANKLGGVGQLGLFAGPSSDKCIRGGLIPRWGTQEGPHYNQFLVHNDGGRDTQMHIVGPASFAEDRQLTLQRLGGKYTLMVENLNSGVSCTVANPHPTFLDSERDLYVGLFGCVPWRPGLGKLYIKEFKVTVWTLAQVVNR
jgi:hypothetical protein